MIFTTWRFWVVFVIGAVLGTWLIFLLHWEASPWRILIYIINGTAIIVVSERWNNAADDRRWMHKATRRK